MKELMMVAGCALIMVSAAVAGDAPAVDKPAGAKPPPREWREGMGMREMDGDMAIMPIMQMNKELGLSKEQMDQIKAVFLATSDEMKALRTKMETLAKAQAELMSQDMPNEDIVLKNADEIGAIRAKIGRIRMKQMLDMHKILTPEQRVNLRAKMKAKMEKHAAMGERMKHRGEGLKKGPDKGANEAEAVKPAGQAPACKAE